MPRPAPPLPRPPGRRPSRRACPTTVPRGRRSPRTAMPTHILMNVLDEQELRVAVIRDGRLEHPGHERSTEGQHLGNIYKARIANVEPSLDAAFLDLGAGKNGFIHIDEIAHDKGPGKRIEHVLPNGQEVIVQITKEAIKDKGPG